MKKMYILFICFFAYHAYGQDLVSTEPQTKVAVMEEFTGVNCPNCPAGHNVAADILASYPGEVIVINYSPGNSNYTTPIAGNPDFRRTYLDPLYNASYVGSRFMPGAMVNRKTVSGERMMSRGIWKTNVANAIKENSPVNVGVLSNYDSGTNTLTVKVEAYYTADVNNDNFIYVHLMEDGLVANQTGSGGGSNYVHKHTFRENINTSIWGDAMNVETKAGNLYSQTFTYDLANASDPINLENAQVVAFVYDPTVGELYSGAIATALNTTSSNKNIELFESMNLYPNPSNGLSLLEIISDDAQTVQMNIINAVGQVVSTSKQNIQSGQNVIQVNQNNQLSKGLYFVQIRNNEGTQTMRLKIID